MELRVLNYFLVIAREENITRAAQSLHITQPTLSRQIAQHEEELGVRLFRRGNHSIVLTEEGMLLKRRAQEILSLAEKTRQDLSHKEELLTGKIAIGSGEFQSTAFLSELIGSFHQKYPLVQYSIYSGNAENIRDSIERGLLDLGLMSEPIDIRKYDFLSTSQKEVWGVVVSKDSDLARKEFVTPEDLADRPLIMPANEFLLGHLEKWFGRYLEDLNIVARGNLLYNLAMLAAGGIGAVVTIRLNCTYDNCRFVPLYPSVESGSVLAWKKGQAFSRATDAFIEYAKQYIKGISNY